MVFADLDVRKQRLVDRGLEMGDIEARLANQVSDEQRAAVADFVIVNNASLQELRDNVTKVWQQISA